MWESAESAALDNDRVRKRAINISTEVITQFWLLIIFLIKYAGTGGVYLNFPRARAIPINFFHFHEDVCYHAQMEFILISVLRSTYWNLGLVEVADKSFHWL